jgi:uridine phosphorylase
VSESYPILEFDIDPRGVIDPQKLIAPHPEMPDCCVLCFFLEAIEELRTAGKLTEITELRSEMGKNPVHRFKDSSRACAIAHPGVGAPLAAGFLEEIIALGARKIIVCGGAGSLKSGHEVGKLLVPTAAIRDEGTSYHYLPPAREVEPTAKALEALQATLAERSLPYVTTKTWTTDAFYRETKQKIARRREEGCHCVEMEASALFAVARFRSVELAGIFYAGDDLTGEAWDSRNWHTKPDIRRNLLEVAVAACLQIA